jgi:hypothetical protein
MRSISLSPIPRGIMKPNMATVAAEIGDAVTARIEVTAEIDIGRSGRTPALRETSPMIGSSA